MATYYPNFSQQRDLMSTPYQGESKLDSFPQLPLHSGNMTMYSNQGASGGSFTDIYPGNSLPSHNPVEISSLGGRNEMVFIPPTGDTASMQSFTEQLNAASGNAVGHSGAGDSQVVQRTQLGFLSGEQNFQFQGLSLSLGTEMPSAVSIPSFQFQNTNTGLSSLLVSQIPVSGVGTVSSAGDGNHQNKELGNSNCFPSGITGLNPPGDKSEISCNPHRLEGTKEMHSYPYLYEPSGYASMLNSKYLRTAQQLLDEVVNVRDALKQPESKKHQNKSDVSKDGDGKSDSQPLVDPDDSNNKSCDLSPAERQDLENKKSKLLSMLDEVDRRYRQYYHQMQVVVSSFDRVAGFGAAKPYTSLALKTISRHFRCLRDAINGQIQLVQRNLGEQDNSTSQGGVIPRLRYVDHQLRQQRALQQLGVMRHSWRPQRGLPEHAVSILRAWLFEHFLHPYPKDSEKVTLARQTGLSRHQVANWFINARVRLWKPMIEEMYKEEFGESETDPKSSTENSTKAPKDQSCTLENSKEEVQDNVTSKAAEHVHQRQHLNSKSDNTPSTEMNDSMGRTTFQQSAQGDDGGDYRGLKSERNQRPRTDDCNLYPYNIISSNQNGSGGSMAAAPSYAVPDTGGFAFGNQVSLALGLQHRETDGFSISREAHLRGNDVAVSSIGPDLMDYQCLEFGEQQSRFGNQHMLHDFVV